MQTYTCPTCGEKMERDLSLFMEHTDKHIIEEVRKKNPEWVTKEGFCHKCLEYFKNQIHNSGRSTGGTNIGPSGVRLRLLLGLLGYGAAAGTFFWLRGADAPRPAWLVLFPLFFMGTLGLLQATRKLCVVIAQKQEEAMRRKARAILLLAFLVSAFLTAACFTATPVAAETSDEKLRAAFPSRDTRDTHESMMGQKKTLTAIQSGFLSGDDEAVEREVGVLARNMKAVGRTIPAEASTDIEMWTLLYQIVTEAEAMKESADKKDFSGVYGHYATLVGKCVACHQGMMTASAAASVPVAPTREGQPVLPEEESPE